MADGPKDQAGYPEAQAETDRARQRAVDDGERARGAAEQYRLGQRPMDGGVEARDRLGGFRHQTSAPPPNEPNARKKLDAANAIDRPNTIWMSRPRPPAVSRNASVRHVPRLKMTASNSATKPTMRLRHD